MINALFLEKDIEGGKYVSQALFSRFGSRKIIFLFAIVYSIIIVLIPWDAIRNQPFADYLNYLERFEELREYGESYINPAGTILGFFLEESLWAYFLLGCSILGLTAEVSLYAVSFFCLLTISYFVFTKSNLIFASLLLLNPLIIDLILSQHRSALALSLFLIMVSRNSKFIILVLFVVGMLIHTVTIILYGFYFLSLFFSRNKKNVFSQLNKVFPYLVFMFSSLILIYGKEIILSFLGDRRGNVDGNSVSLMYTFFWLGIYFIFFVMQNEIKDKYFYMCIAFLSVFIVAAFSGVYGLRYLTLAYPFFIISIVQFRGVLPLFMFMFMMMYQYLQWVYWLEVFIN